MWMPFYLDVYSEGAYVPPHTQIQSLDKIIEIDVGQGIEMLYWNLSLLDKSNHCDQLFWHGLQYR